MDSVTRAVLLCQRSRHIVARARSNVLRARALAITVRHTGQVAADIRRLNHLIRGLQR
ncbi:MAG TPA: hypothetical protein VJQ58_07830 [Burkholderiales bacterium]|nr:hypothetical protein [Burkholderiales bacterium]